MGAARAARRVLVDVEAGAHESASGGAVFVSLGTPSGAGAMSAPRRGIKHRDPEAWKGRLREDVLERVRANREAILSRARRDDGAGVSPGDARVGLKRALAEVLDEALEDARTRRLQSGEGEGAARGREARGVLAPRVAASTASGAPDPRSPRGTMSDVARMGASASSSSSLTSWGEAADALTGVEYEDLMAAMHARVEEDIAREEADALAAEIERRDAEEAAALDAAVRDLESWEIDARASDRDDPVVLCPVCRTRRLLRTNETIFCGCGDFRLRRDTACEPRVTRGADGGDAAFGLARLRERLERAWDVHARGGGEDDATDPPPGDDRPPGSGACRGRLRFEVRDAFGVEALYAECDECGFLEAVM